VSEQTTASVEVPTVHVLGRGRWIGVYLLLFVGGLLLLTTSFAVWANRVALNTNQFVSTSSRLIEDDRIRQVIATRAVDTLYDNVDVQAELQKQAPKDLKPFSAVAAAGLRQGAYVLVDRTLQQPQLQGVWQATLRQAHGQLVDVLEGGGPAVSTEQGVVTLDLRRIVLDTADRIGLGKTAQQKLPPDVGRVEVLRSDQLRAAQGGFELLKTLAWFLPLLTLAAFAGAVYLGFGRRRAVLRDVGLVIVTVGILGLIASRLVGGYVVDALTTDTQTRAAGNDAWTIVTGLLRSSFRWQIVVGILIVLATWLAGPRRYALECRHALAPILRQRMYPYIGLAVVALVLFATGPVADFARILSVLVVLALLAAGIEILRRQTLLEFPEESLALSLASTRARVTSWLETQRVARSAPPRTPTTAGPRSDLTAQLTELADLHARGALTDEEYAAAKARVLAGG
jgi:putative oligomerization/nucleic acid binding protein